MAYEKLNEKLLKIEETTPITNNTEMYRVVKKILDKEVRKIINKDFDLINECIEILLSLQGYEIEQVDALAKKHQYQSNEKPKNKRFNKKFIIAAIVILSVLVLTQLIAMAFGYNPVGEIYAYFTANPETVNFKRSIP